MGFLKDHILMVSLKIFHIHTIINSVTYDIFNKVEDSNHCLYHLLRDALRTSVQLLNCIYRFHKQSFIVSSLFRFLK